MEIYIGFLSNFAQAIMISYIFGKFLAYLKPGELIILRIFAILYKSFNKLRNSNKNLLFINLLIIVGAGYRSQYSNSLRTGQSGDRIPVEANFPKPSRTTLVPILPPVKRIPDPLLESKVAGKWS
jgi:hypothetical protein